MNRPIPISAFIIIAANLVTVAGVIFFGWNMVDILFLYWAESGIIGVFNILKMLLCRGKEIQNSPLLGAILAKLSVCGFFVIHFGGFMAGHGAFLLTITEELLKQSADPLTLIKVTRLGLFTLLLSHTYSFCFNYVRRGEWKKAELGELMAAPYSRIVLMHVSLIFGLFASLIFGQAVFLLLVFVVIKTAFDLAAHLSEHGTILFK